MVASKYARSNYLHIVIPLSIESQMAEEASDEIRQKVPEETVTEMHSAELTGTGTCYVYLSHKSI